MARWRAIGMTVGAAVLVLGALGAGLAAWGGPLLDLRPAEISLDTPQPEREARGRALLQAAYEAHGAQAWMAHPGQRLEMRDTWPGWMGTVGSPWPHPDMRLTVHQRRHSFDSDVVLHGGEVEGTVWAIRDGQPLRQAPGGEREPVDDATIAFILPTVHYFVELPQRLTEAELVRHVGTETVGGSDYEVVYATWGSWAANETFDQYLVYIDPESGRIEKVAYTVREIARFIGGTAHYQAFQELDGVTLGTRITITNAVTDDPSTDQGLIHRMVIEEMAVEAL